MDNGNLRAWRSTATSGIRCKRDRVAVGEEYRQHMDEKWESLYREGLPEKEITGRILTDLGSAEEVAPILAQIHKPYWGYALTVLKWATLLLIVVSLITIHHAHDSSSMLSVDNFFSDRPMALLTVFCCQNPTPVFPVMITPSWSIRPQSGNRA